MSTPPPPSGPPPPPPGPGGDTGRARRRPGVVRGARRAAAANRPSEPVAPHAGRSAFTRTRPKTPMRQVLLDAGVVLVLGLLAMTGLGSTFAGWQHLLAGGIGLMLGIALALLAHRLGQPVVVLTVLSVVTFFVLGGAIALHGLGGTAWLPVPDTISLLARTAVEGWKQLLTTLPPVDPGPLLTLPYLLGLVGGAAGTTAAARVRTPVAPVVPMVMLFALVILLGVRVPGQVALLAGGFAAVTIGWIALRGRRLRTLRAGGHRLSRRLTAVALCVGAAAVAVVGSPILPGVGDDRVVLRSEVVPPFDVGQYASPLAGFRRYTEGYVTDEKDRKLYDQELFTVSGVPAGTRIRIAALDSYDGSVWRAANESDVEDGPPDTFVKVGSEISNPIAREREDADTVTGTVEIADGYDGVWLPAPGALTGIEFVRPDAQTGSDIFRYNLATSTGVLPSGLETGDSYEFSAVVPEDGLTDDMSAWDGGTYAAEASQFGSLANDWSGEGDPLQQVRDVAAHMKSEGAYTDGEPPNQQYPSGHSLRRLTDFVAAGGQMAGNDEQFAAMMAILANQLGVPARIVMGAELPENGVVKGRHVHAWVELRVADGSWRTLDWPEFMDTEREPEQESPTPEELVEGDVIPPPVPVRPPSTDGDPLDDSVNQRADAENDEDDGSAWWWGVLRVVAYAAAPVLLLLAVLGAIVGLKVLRRRLRRTRGSPERRLRRGWREVLDALRDFGVRTPLTATRTEQATAAASGETGPGTDRLGGLATATEVRMFAAEPPTTDQVTEHWTEIDSLRADLKGSHNRWARLRAAANLATFRPRPRRR